MHKSLTTYSGALADGLGIQHRMNLLSYTQLQFAFILSGCMHADGMRSLPILSDITVREVMER